jgi:hypothetical protein
LAILGFLCVKDVSVDGRIKIMSHLCSNSNFLGSRSIFLGPFFFVLNKFFWVQVHFLGLDIFCMSKLIF